MLYRAKYIEGLENRLGRMESLLRLSGMQWWSCRVGLDTTVLMCCRTSKRG